MGLVTSVDKTKCLRGRSSGVLCIVVGRGRGSLTSGSGKRWFLGKTGPLRACSQGLPTPHDLGEGLGTAQLVRGFWEAQPDFVTNT